jgi:hypothetical protein
VSVKESTVGETGIVDGTTNLRPAEVPAGRAVARARAVRLAPVVAVLAVATLSSVTAWSRPVYWADPDSLFYQAQSLELQGHNRWAALDEVFSGPLAQSVRAWNVKLTQPPWTHYSSRFYRRRWFTPALGAALAPIFGTRSLLVVSLLGYFAIGVLLYALLRRRFSVATSVVVTGICLWLPPVRWYAFQPMTDSWGLALLLAALLAAGLVIERGSRWLSLWIAMIALLAITRDETIVAGVAAAWLAVGLRTRRAASLAITGLAVTLAFPLLVGASWRENLAYIENDFRRPHDTSWSYVLGHYWRALHSTLHDDIFHPQLNHWSFAQTVLWYTGCAVVCLALVLLLLQRRSGPFFTLMCGALLGAAVLIVLSVNYSRFRIELAFVPSIAVGLALMIEALAGRLPGRYARL